MRIAIITAHSPLARTADHVGYELDPVAVARGLASQGHRVTMYARAEDAVFPRTAILGAGVSVEHVKAGPARALPAEQAARYMPEMATELADRWRARKPDVVHAFSWSAGLAAIGAVRGTDIPVVQSFGSLGSLARRQARADVSAARIKLEASIGRTVAAVVATSEEEADELARLSVPKSVIRVVPAGIDTAQFAPASARAKGTGPASLVTAADDQARGIAAIVRALTQLPQVTLTVVGGPDARHMPRSGPFREAASLASALGVRNRVTFAGELSAGELTGVLQSADVMVSAAGYAPTGLPVIQAMACGLPVVASAVGGQRDAVIDGISGLLIAPDNPAMLVQRLRALLGRPAMLQAYGIAAADRAGSRYSMDRVARETVAAYDRCLRARTAAEAADDDAEADLDEAADLREAAAFG